MAQFRITGIETSNFVKYSDGFSFKVKTELDAYKAAYVYQNVKKTTVNFLTTTGEWLVQIYK